MDKQYEHRDDKMKNRNTRCLLSKTKWLANVLLVFIAILLLSSCQKSSPNLNPCFSINAVAGTPSHETLQADSFEDAAGRIRFKGTSTGQLRLFLPVINTTGQLTNNVKWDRFKIMYRDPDGNRENYRVSATLQYLDATGSTPTIAELDSNTQASDGINTMTTSFTHDFDFTNRYYYVEIKIYRQNTNANPWVGGLNLCERFQ